MTKDKTMLGYMAIDQHGTTYHFAAPPRKWLLNRFGRQHAKKMYVDTKDGGHRHIGYVIAGLWLTVYRVNTWKE